ncbi:sugar ABC transporter substrate-binding protein [Paenibacillus oryzisoli]|uniref:ABC transporter substrate-binding protein n=1 Tax=Paenibacillus oryzisoli TaxID=1850517 RepID=UPI003D2A2BC8
MSNKLKKSVTILVTGAVAMGLTACSSNNAAQKGDAQSTGKGPAQSEVVNMLYWPGPESDAITKVIAAYNSDQGKKDGVEVKMAPAPREGFWEKEATMMSASNSDIDVYMTATYKVGEQNQSLVPLEDKLGDGLKVFIGTTVDSLKSDGHVYGVPMDVSNQFMYYRKDLVDKLLSDAAWQAKYKQISQQIVGKELSPKKPDDWNWDDFKATAAFFTKKYNADSPTEYGTALPAKNLIYNIMIWDDVLYSFGGSWYTDDGKANFGNDAAKKALSVYSDIFKNDLTPASSSTFEYPETNQAFQTGKAALILQWSAAYHELSDKSKNPTIFDKVGLAPIPGDQHKTHVHVLAVGLNKSSKHQDAAVKWLKYLSTEAAQKIYAQNGGIPSVKSILKGMKAERPEFPVIAEHVDKYGFVEDTSANVNPVLEILAKNFSAAWAGQVSVDNALKQANTEVNQKVGK